VYLEVDDVQKSMSLLQATPGVSRIEHEPPGISIVLNGVERKAIVAALVNAGVGVETVASRHRLEDAFLEMVEGDSR
jgi:ABC-2 type transport system ATP-binding protein